MSAEAPGTLALIDLSSIFYPAYHMVASDPTPDAAVLSAYRRVVQLSTKWPHVAICADKGKSFRAGLQPSYKAQRKEKDAVLSHQLGKLIEKLEADGFPVWRQDGYEADDVIASAVQAAYERGLPVAIVTADKDLLQLVNDAAGILVYSVMKDAEMREADVVAKYGVAPSLMRDYLALVGDTSDNIEGVRGIGAKTAAEVLNLGLPLDDVIEKCSTGNAAGMMIGNATTLKLAGARETVKAARELITLAPEVEIDLDAALQPRTPRNRPTIEDAMTDMLEYNDTPEPKDTKPMTPMAALGDRVLSVLSSSPTTAAEPAKAIAPKSTDIAVAPKARPAYLDETAPESIAWERQLEPRSLAAGWSISKWIYDSRLYMQFGSIEAVFSVLLSGRELGLPAMAALRGFHVVEGKPTLAADLVRSLVLQSGKAEYLMCVERTATQSTWTTKRKGDPEAVRLTYTLDEAKTANLVRPNSGWTKHTSDMLAKTASTKLCRLVYPDVCFGLYAPSELGGEE